MTKKIVVLTLMACLLACGGMVPPIGQPGKKDELTFDEVDASFNEFATIVEGIANSQNQEKGSLRSITASFTLLPNKENLWMLNYQWPTEGNGNLSAYIYLSFPEESSLPQAFDAEALSKIINSVASKALSKKELDDFFEAPDSKYPGASHFVDDEDEDSPYLSMKYKEDGVNKYRLGIYENLNGILELTITTKIEDSKVEPTGEILTLANTIITGDYPLVTSTYSRYYEGQLNDGASFFYNFNYFDQDESRLTWQLLYTRKLKTNDGDIEDSSIDLLSTIVTALSNQALSREQLSDFITDPQAKYEVEGSYLTSWKIWEFGEKDPLSLEYLINDENELWLSLQGFLK